MVTVQGASERVITDLQEQEKSIQADPKDDIAKLRRQVEQLGKETAQMEEVELATKCVSFSVMATVSISPASNSVVNGLLSSSMAPQACWADTVVNAVRRRNMSDSQKKLSPKWVWTMRTVEWLLAQLPPSSRFQLYIFNTEVQPAIIGSEGEWLDAADSLGTGKSRRGLAQLFTRIWHQPD